MLIVPRRRAAASWTPAQISTALWLDASDSSTITQSSGAVSQWNDKSGNSRHATQSTATKRPAYTTNGLNGLPVATFDGSDDFMQFTGVHDATWSIAAVARLSDGADFIVQFGAINQFGALFRQDNILVARPSTIVGAFFEFLSTATTIATATYGASQTNIWRNGTVGTPYAGGGVSSNATSYIGAYGPDSNQFSLAGFIAEIIVTNGEDSTAARQIKEGYLAHKWDLTANLPADHPYKTAAP